jgi:hypothetical protein
MSQTLYAGPGKVYINSIALFPEGENGSCNILVDEKTAPAASAMHGRVAETWEDVTAKITTTPFDNWGNMATLYPAFTGVSVGSTTGALVIGTNPMAMAAVDVWGTDGSLYAFVNGAITKHPDIFLGPGKPLFGSCEITCIGDPTKNPGAAGFLMSSPITESGAADPGGAMAMSDFIRGWWSGAWGAVTGFTALEAEDFWTISVNAKYSFQTVQKVTRRAKLDSVEIMAKCRPVGMTHTQLAAKIFAHTHGQLMQEVTATDLVLSGPSSKTITLKNCEIKGAGFEFGGTKLRTGDVAFVSAMTFTAGAPQPLLIISA